MKALLTWTKQNIQSIALETGLGFVCPDDSHFAIDYELNIVSSGSFHDRIYSGLTGTGTR